MSEFLETRYDKFIFRVATDCYYHQSGVWAREEAGGVRIGVTDFLQQSSGDVAFIDVQPAETAISAGDDVVEIETIKVTISLPTPLAGKILMVNPVLQDTPEVVNQAPYGAGWLALIAPADWEADRARLLDPLAYLAHVEAAAEDEAKRL